jgi:hypothetical protein
MKFAIIENGVVANITVSDEALAENWIESEQAQIGDRYENGVVIKYDPKQDPVATQAMAGSVRAERDAKLAQTDWRVIKALESNTPQDFEWAAYRQALRDVTAQSGFPWTIDWPTQP